VKDGAFVDVVDIGVSSSPVDRMDLTEPNTDDLGRAERMLREGRRIFEGDGWRGGLGCGTSGIGACASCGEPDNEGERRFLRVLAVSSCIGSLRGVG